MATEQYIVYPAEGGGGGSGVTSLNGQTGALTLLAGTNITITPGAGTLTIDATAGGGTVTSVTGLAPISSTGGATPQISISQSGIATDGYLSSVDWNIFNNKVSSTRAINTTAPLQGGGNLSADRTLSITQSGASTDGYLSSVDWNIFNNKQAAGSYITALTGDVTATGPGSVAATIANSAVTNAKMANMADNTVKANKSGGAAAPSDLALSDVVEAVSNILTITNGSKSVVASANLSIEVQQASSTTDGYLSAADWNMFNTGGGSSSAITGLTGDVVAVGPGFVASTIPYLTKVAKITLSSGDITAGFVALPSPATLGSNTVMEVIGGPTQDYGVDFTVSGSVLSWSGLALDGVLVAGDKLVVQYT